MYYFSGFIALVVAVAATYGMTEVFPTADYTRLEQGLASARSGGKR